MKITGVHMPTWDSELQGRCANHLGLIHKRVMQDSHDDQANLALWWEIWPSVHPSVAYLPFEWWQIGILTMAAQTRVLHLRLGDALLLPRDPRTGVKGIHRYYGDLFLHSAKFAQQELLNYMPLCAPGLTCHPISFHMYCGSYFVSTTWLAVCKHKMPLFTPLPKNSQLF